MLGLEELALKVFVKQCIATIVEYHGFHRSDTVDQIEKDIKTRIAIPDKELLPQLKSEIELDIKKSEDYKLREPLLNYCLDLFAMINTIIEKNELVDPETVDQIKHEIEQFLLTMQKLFTKNKDTEFKIYFNNKEYSLWGFQNTGARSYLSPYCQSGYIIEARFFKTLKFKLPTEFANKASAELTAQAEKEIKNTVKEMVDEFQLPLITARLKIVEELLTTQSNKIKQLEEGSKAQEEKINTLENRLNTDSNLARIAKLEEQLAGTSKLSSDNKNLKDQLQVQALAGTVSHNQIKSLEKTIQELQQQLAGSKQAPAEPKAESRKDLTGLSTLRPGFFTGMLGQPSLGMGMGSGLGLGGLGLKLLDPTNKRGLNTQPDGKPSSFTNS